MGEPAVFVVGMLAAESFDTAAVSGRLEDEFGALAFRGEPYPFDFTSYYDDELGKDLSRHWLVFSELFASHLIADRKKFCQKLEENLADSAGNRRVNIDPGYVTGAKFVLSSGKNNAHRIALEEKIYAELTLIYRDSDWRSLDWTYPEFSSQVPGEWLGKARRHWLDKS